MPRASTGAAGVPQSGAFVRRVASTAGGVAAQTFSLSERIADLFIPWRWSQGVFDDMLNSEVSKRDEITAVWRDTTLTGHQTTSVTAALIAAVISAAFSWYNIQTSHWAVKALWYSSLVFAVTAVSVVGVNINALLRLKCLPESAKSIQRAVGKRVKGTSRWESRPLQPWAWGLPNFMLKLSILFFLAGLAFDIWWEAAQNWRWGSDEVKIAIFVTCAAGFAGFNYLISIFCLFYKTVDRDYLMPRSPIQMTSVSP